MNAIKSKALQDPLFQVACGDEDFKRLLYHCEVRWLSLGKCLMRFVTLFDRVVEFHVAKHEELKEKLSFQKTLIIYLEEIFGQVNIINLSLQSNDMNLVKAKFIHKLELWKINTSNNKWSDFQKLQMQEVDEEKGTIICNHSVFLHDNFNVRFHDLLQLNIPIFGDRIGNMYMQAVSYQAENLQMELCAVLGNDRFLQDARDDWMQAWLRNSAKYPNLFEQVLPFIVNLPTSYLTEQGFSMVVLHSLGQQRNRLQLENSLGNYITSYSSATTNITSC